MAILIVGILAGALCTISFIPQIIKICETKNAKDLSLVTFIVFALGVSMWLLYGILTNDIPIIAANIITLCLIVAILILRIKYK